MIFRRLTNCRVISLQRRREGKVDPLYVWLTQAYWKHWRRKVRSPLLSTDNITPHSRDGCQLLTGEDGQVRSLASSWVRVLHNGVLIGQMLLSILIGSKVCNLVIRESWATTTLIMKIQFHDHNNDNPNSLRLLSTPKPTMKAQLYRTAGLDKMRLRIKNTETWLLSSAHLKP